MTERADSRWSYLRGPLMSYKEAWTTLHSPILPLILSPSLGMFTTIHSSHELTFLPWNASSLAPAIAHLTKSLTVLPSHTLGSLFSLSFVCQSHPHSHGIFPHRVSNAVLCHYSPRQIFLAFRQDPLYSKWRPLSIYIASPSCEPGNQNSWPHHSPSTLLPADFCFCPIRATHGSHPWLIHISPHHHVCHQGPAWPCSSYHFWEKLWNVMENWDNGDS